MRIAAGSPDARTLNTLLGPWYASLRKHGQGSALQPFLKVVIEVAAVHFDGALGLDAAHAIVEETTDYLRSSEAAKLLGFSVSRMHKAIQDGECKHRARRFGTRGQVYEIPRSEVERVRAQRSAWVSIDQACELAGVPASVLAHMMSAGVIRSDANWRTDLLKGGPVDQCSVLELVERIRVAAQPEAVRDDDKLTCAGLTSRRMGDRQAIQSLMSAISRGEVKAVAVGRRLGDMVFRRTDVTPYFGTPLLESGMSVHSLSRLTGWKSESIAHWIEQGLLQAESIELRGQPCRVVLPHQVLAFRHQYMPLADLAQGMGTKSSALSRLLSGIEVVGALKLPGGASRGGLIRVAELGQLAVLGARAGHDLFVPAASR
jgi:predicted DNA-binding transcriptional regulator AlpA